MASVVFEDNVRLSMQLPDLLSQLDRLPKRIDVYRFEASPGCRVWLSSKVASDGGFDFYGLASGVIGTGGYAIRGHAAGRLVDRFATLKGPVDEIFSPDSSRALGLGMVQTLPVLAEQSTEHARLSTIHLDPKDRKKPSAAHRIRREIVRVFTRFSHWVKQRLAGHTPVRLRMV